MGQRQDAHGGARDQEHGYREGAEAPSGEDTLFGSCRRRHQSRNHRLEEKARRVIKHGMAIEITDKAVDEVRRMMQKENVQAAGLRVGVKGGGCSGLSYNLTFESQSRTGDKVFEREGVKLFCDLKSYIYLNGTVLDFDGGLMGKGFVFMNPNAKKSCGCGSSFST